MKRDEERALRGLRSVRDFLDRTTVTMAAVDTKVLRTQLDDVIEQLTAMAVTRARHENDWRTVVQGQRRRRRYLELELLGPVRRMSRRIAEANPQLREVLLLPRARTIEALMVQAEAVAAAAEAAPEAFVAAAVVADFPAEVRRAVDALRSLVDRATAHRSRRSGAVAGARREAMRGRYVVGLLDAALRPALASDPRLLRDWQAVRATASYKARGTPREDAASTGEVTPVARAA